jgi:hypothetical protein
MAWKKSGKVFHAMENRWGAAQAGISLIIICDIHAAVKLNIPRYIR